MKKYLIASGVAVLAFASIAAAQGYVFNTNLTVGSTGPDVVALQNALIASGYSIPSITSGAASTGYFGSQTLAAVKAYQTAHSIPNTGFVGPLTRAALNGGTAMTGSTGSTGFVCPPGYQCIATGSTGSTGSTGALSGGEGQLKNFDLIGSVSSETIDEGENAGRVLGVEMEAEDSDIRIDRVDVDFTAPNSGSRRLTDYVDTVSLWLGSTKLASLDAGSVSRDTGNVYSFRFSGINAVVKDGDVASLYVAVDAVSNVDSNDTGSWTVAIPTNGIRATDAAGISETYVGSSDSLSETFTVGSANSGELNVTEASSNPDAGIVTVSETNDTENVTLAVIDLEAKNSDLTIHDLPVGLVASGADADQIVKALKLVNGSTVLKSKSIPSTAGTSYQVVFDNIDFDISEGDTETLKVVADINDLDGSFGEGDSVYATTTAGDAAWDVEDAHGDAVTPDGSTTGEAQSFYADGIGVSFVSSSAKLIAGDAQAAEDDKGEFVIKFSVKANGANVYLDKGTTATTTPGSNSDGLSYSTTTDSTTGTTTTALFTSETVESNDSTSNFYIAKGQTRTFTLTVTATSGLDGYTAIALSGFKWGTTTSPSSLYTQNLVAYKTDPIYLENR